MSLVAGGLIGFFTPHPAGPPIDVVTPDPTATPSPPPTPAPFRVYVCGAVAAPAVYELPPGSLVEDALDAAGGPTADADLNRVNLAQELSDQQQVTVPQIDEAVIPTPSPGEPPTPQPAHLDLNTATAAELDALPQIGPATAQAIVDYRETYGPFEAPEEILEIPGIGPSTFEQIQDLITVE
jgi:competence protein ComEA